MKKVKLMKWKIIPSVLCEVIMLLTWLLTYYVIMSILYESPTTELYLL